MSFTLDKIFTTATALSNSHVIKEIAPCDALRPYVRCFWEADYSPDAKLRIIPDCCADLLFYTKNGKICSNFCGVSNRSFISNGNTKTFGIRFYAWSVNLFSSVNMHGTLNGYLPADSIFTDINTLTKEIFQAATLSERIDAAQKYLINKLSLKENCNVMNSLYKIISQNANVDVKLLSDYCTVSKRSLERDFRTNTGLSPKEIIELIRYQLLWQECLKPEFNVINCVEKFGFYDCSHLYKDFKKFHGISLPQAVKCL